MGRCKNCGVEMGLDETCVFATYRTNVGGQEIIVCCQNCATELERAAQQAVEVKPAPAPARKRPSRPARKAPRKVHKAPRKAKKAPKKKARRAAAKRPRRAGHKARK